MHVRKNAAFPRFDIKKYILVIREIESICRRTALEPIIYEVCVTLIIKCIARVSNPDDTAILDCTALVQHKPEEPIRDPFCLFTRRKLLTSLGMA